MSNSPLVSFTRISPNKNRPRNHRIDKITVHHMAMVGGTVERCGAVFAPKSRKASSNYGIGIDGRVGLYVDEGDRSWASSNARNDNRAVTIEVANDGGAPDWHVSDASWNSLVELCADICRRNGIPRLVWTGDANGSLTCHYMFAATACPGPYLKRRMAELATAVNAKLGSAPAPQPAPEPQGLAVDGYWGEATTRRIQEVLGCPFHDGKISRQNPQHKHRLKACTVGWEFSAPWGEQPGSQTIGAIQRACGVPADGFIGPDTINAMIRHFKPTSGAKVEDGKLDAGSLTVKAMQRALNEGRF